MILVTGGAGFIGSAFVQQWVEQEQSSLVTYDKLTYAGHLLNLSNVQKNDLHTFILGDICDRPHVKEVLQRYRPKYLLHCAAESHVDRSIAAPAPFITTNIVGTFALLEETLNYWQHLPLVEKEQFRFLHLSTDEVYGSIQEDSPPADEESRYAPNSPYAASKASSDHLARSYHRTYQLPVVTVHTSNNFGPRQFPEKLIPTTILNALAEKPLPLYGDGMHIRDWIYVEEHCRALRLLLHHGIPGECYNISSSQEMKNIDVIKAICSLLDNIKPRANGHLYAELIRHVQDRPGHDRRYSMSSEKLKKEMNWHLQSSFADNLEKTILWYIDNVAWIKEMTK